MSIWSRRYRQQRRYIERMKCWPFFEINGLLVVDAVFDPTRDIENEPWFNPSDPDFGIWLDSGRNEIEILHERLAKTEQKARRIALSLLEEVAIAWKNRLCHDYPNNTWTLYVTDEECGTYKKGQFSWTGGRSTSLYFFNRHFEREQLHGEIRVLYHSGTKK